GMRLAADETLRAVPSGGVAGGIESSERCECRICSVVAVGRINTRQVNAYCRHIGRTCAQVAEAVIDSEPVTADWSIFEIRYDSDCVRKLDLMAGSQGSEVVLKALQIELRVRLRLLASFMRKDELPPSVVSGRQGQRHECISKRNGSAWQGCRVGIE